MPNSPPPRYEPGIFHERSGSPLADMQMDFAALRHEFLALQTRMLEIEYDTLKAIKRLNQMDAGMSLFVQELELSAGRERRKRNGPLREQETESAAQAS